MYQSPPVESFKAGKQFLFLIPTFAIIDFVREQSNQKFSVQNTAKYGGRKRGGVENVSSDLIYVEFSYFIPIREDTL